MHFCAITEVFIQFQKTLMLPGHEDWIRGVEWAVCGQYERWIKWNSGLMAVLVFYPPADDLDALQHLSSCGCDICFPEMVVINTKNEDETLYPFKAFFLLVSGMFTWLILKCKQTGVLATCPFQYTTVCIWVRKSWMLFQREESRGK